MKHHQCFDSSILFSVEQEMVCRRRQFKRAKIDSKTFKSKSTTWSFTIKLFLFLIASLAVSDIMPRVNFSTTSVLNRVSRVRSSDTRFVFGDLVEADEPPHDFFQNSDEDGDDENEDFLALKKHHRPSFHRRTKSMRDFEWDVDPFDNSLAWQDGHVDCCSQQETIGFDVRCSSFADLVPDDHQCIAELDVIVKHGEQLQWSTMLSLAESFQISRKSGPLIEGHNAIQELIAKAVRNLSLQGKGDSAREVQARLNKVLQSSTIDQKMLINRFIDTIGAFVWCDESPWSFHERHLQGIHVHEFFELCKRTCIKFKHASVTQQSKKAQIKLSLQTLVRFDDGL